jgi:aspartate kinase
MASPVELIEAKSNMAMVIAESLPNRPGIAAELFSHLGKGGFNIEMITETSAEDSRANIAFAIDAENAEAAIEHLNGLSSLEIAGFSITRGMGILTIYGKNLSREPGVAGKVFSILAQEAINIEMISTSFTSITVLIKESYLAPAKNLMMNEFGLNA